MMKDGLIGIAFTLATASRSVPSASGFAGLLKPIWLSLICRNVNPVGSAASASPINPTEWGTPPLTVHSTPVPAQTMHSSTSRRPNPCPRSSKPFLAMSHSPCGPNGTKWRRIAPLNRRLGRLELYSQKYTVSPIRGSRMTPLLAPSSAKIRRECPSKDAISRFDCARQQAQSPDGGTPHSLPHRFQISQLAGARWYRQPDAAQG